MSLSLGLATPPIQLMLGLNFSLLLIRFALCWAIAPSYDFSQAQAIWSFWLSPLADPLAVYRIWLSSSHRPTEWRGRHYRPGNAVETENQ
jgi:dolichol-phosphate mannosyltransferase